MVELHPSILVFLADETLVCIASYLLLEEVPLLVATCCCARQTLVAGQGAAVKEWMKALQENS